MKPSVYIKTNIDKKLEEIRSKGVEVTVLGAVAVTLDVLIQYLDNLYDKGKL